MGNREALLAGAKRCLFEKGFSRTTARDIANASGVSLAAIGYHFGTKEELLTAALISAIDDLDVEFRRTASAVANANATPIERFEAIWTRIIESFSSHRQLWIANFEIFSQIDRSGALRQLVADGLLQKARAGLVSLFDGVDETTVGERAIKTVGSFYYALLTGVLVQWVIDPEHAPTGEDLATALKVVASRVKD
jgi:AcrR family transcriptional regulator